MAESSVFDQMGQVSVDSGSEFDYVECQAFAERFPNLNEVLFAKKVKGEERSPGRLMLFVDEGKVKVCITCPSEGVCAFTVIASPYTLCEDLESRLKKGTLEWRVDKKSKGAKKAPF